MKKRFILTSLLMLVATPIFARDLSVTSEELGVTIEVQDSRAGEPIARISDSDGTDYSELVSSLNSAIAYQLIHCAQDGLLGRLATAMGCDAIGFQPTDIKVLPYRVLRPDSTIRNDLALALRGDRTYRPTDMQPQETFILNLSYLIRRTRRGESIPYWFNRGTVRSSDREYRDINFDEIF